MFNRNTFATHRRYITPFSIATAAVLAVAFTFVVSCTLVGCNLKGGGTVGSNSDSLTYKTLSIDSTYEQAHQKICLLVVTGGNRDAAKRINDSLAADIGLQAGQSLSSLFKLDDNFIKTYATELADEKKNNKKNGVVESEEYLSTANTAFGGESIDTVYVTLNRNGVFSVAHETHSPTIHMRGEWFVTYHNFESATGKELLLSDLFQPNYTAELTKIAERYFRKQFIVEVMGEKENAKLGELGFSFDSGIEDTDGNTHFALKNSFCLTPEGLRFTYNKFEVSDDATGGMPSFYIPYSELRGLAKAGSVLERLTK